MDNAGFGQSLCLEIGISDNDDNRVQVSGLSHLPGPFAEKLVELLNRQKKELLSIGKNICIKWCLREAKLFVEGLSSLPHSIAKELITLTRDYKNQLLTLFANPTNLTESTSLEPLEQDKIIAKPKRSYKTIRKRNSKISHKMLRAWKIAQPWLLKRLPELEQYGWTRSKLFRAGKLSFPLGDWGVAWYSNWIRPGVQVEIEADGAIRWSWEERDGKTISQTARPPP